MAELREEYYAEREHRERRERRERTGAEGGVMTTTPQPPEMADSAWQDLLVTVYAARSAVIIGVTAAVQANTNPRNDQHLRSLLDYVHDEPWSYDLRLYAELLYHTIMDDGVAEGIIKQLTQDDRADEDSCVNNL